MIKLIIPGKPIAKKRPRFARRGKFVATYNDQETEEGRFLWEVKKQLAQHWRLIKNPIEITTIFYMGRPKNHFGTGKNKERLKNSAPIYHTTKPDIDNLQKMVYDCLNSTVWADDSQICKSTAQKIYSEQPQTIIIIKEVDYGTEKNQ